MQKESNKHKSSEYQIYSTEKQITQSRKRYHLNTNSLNFEELNEDDVEEEETKQAKWWVGFYMYVYIYIFFAQVGIKYLYIIF